jgi:EAL domain-containing protein (putative c-di-GMP-specific phosphodiesterase class I)
LLHPWGECAKSVHSRATAGLHHTLVGGTAFFRLTETTVIASLDLVTQVTQALRAMGVGIALDDFGTGYAGLDYLQSLPFSCLKIDKSFVQQMHTSERSFQIVKAALELSNRLQMSSVAEGIEDTETAEALAGMGCHYAQGFLFARPMPLEEACQWALPA